MLNDPELAAGRLGPAARRYVAALDRAVGIAATAVLIAITAIVAVSVFFRYILNSSFVWSEELATWLFSALIFIGVAVGLRQRRHIAVDLLAAHLPAPLRVLQSAIIEFIVAFSIIMLCFSGAKTVSLITGLSTALQWPNQWRYVAVPVTALVSFTYILLGAIDDRRYGAARLIAIAIAAVTYALSAETGLPFLTAVSPSLIMMTTFLVALVIGVPVAFAILFAVFLATWGADLLPAPAVVQTMVVGSGRFVLLAIPFFLITGYLLNIGGLAQRIIALANALVGHLRGGLAHVNVVNSVLIGGISGSSGADAAGTTKVLVPEMVRAGYSPAFSCAITAAGSILPNIIPPSIAMLIYASMADVSIARLFMSGVGPGLLLALFMMVAVHFVSVKRGYQAGRPRAGFGEVARAFLAAVPALFIAVIITGGIRFGVVTATEAGVLAALWAMILGMFVYRAYSLRQLLATLEECAGDVALIGFLIAVSMPFGWVLIAEQLPQNLLTWTTSVIDNRLLILLAVNVILLIAGCLIDVAANLLIFVPLFLPLVTHIGMDPIHFGVMVIVNLMLGGLTPPVGILVYITATVGRVPTTAVFREVMVFFYASLAALVIIALVPPLSLGLWDLLD